MNDEQRVTVSCRAAGDGWRCDVTVGTDPRATRHQVTVAVELLRSLRPGAEDPEALVRDSFVFLLAREPREAILRSFDLPVINRYFPGWEAKIRRPGAAG